MLQQTQVATVIPYFNRFIERLPTVNDLADADEQVVLRLWQGLGYYSRARNLRKAARRIVDEHGGDVPDTVETLLELPGVGRYTAGAVASIAFDRRAPILDGNVERVLCRIDAIREDPREPQTRQRLWRRAEETLPRKQVGDFNSAMMELGAMICTPRNPQCLICPVRGHCQAQSIGIQNNIPTPRIAKKSPLLHRATFCIRRGERWLIERRPEKGRWAGLWQFITIDRDAKNTDIAGETDALPLPVRIIAPLGKVTHALTHRKYEFHAYLCEATRRPVHAPGENRVWVTSAELDQYPLSRPQLKIAEMLTRIAPPADARTGER